TTRCAPMPSLRSPASRTNQRPSPSCSAGTPAPATNSATAWRAAARTPSGSGRPDASNASIAFLLAPRFAELRGHGQTSGIRTTRGGEHVPDTDAVQVQGLTKSYGDVHAVRGIDFHIARGEVFALLGPNGAGKANTVWLL